MLRLNLGTDKASGWGCSGRGCIVFLIGGGLEWVRLGPDDDPFGALYNDTSFTN